MSEPTPSENRRKRERLNLSLPIRVKCRETVDENWEEVTRLIDVTPFGAAFALSRTVESGRLLLLTIPMPRQLRCYDHIEPQYNIWCLVRHVRKMPTDDEQNVRYSIGVAFIGKYPPVSFSENPGQLYKACEPDELGFWKVQEIGTSENGEPSRRGVDLRRKTRHQIPTNVVIEVFDENGQTVATEFTVTDDISSTGAAVRTTLDVERGRFVRLTAEQYDVTIVAIVRSRQTSKDGIARLNLEFIDRQFPLESVE